MDYSGFGNHEENSALSLKLNDSRYSSLDEIEFEIMNNKNECFLDRITSYNVCYTKLLRSFIFDVAMAPEFEVKVSKRDKVNKYAIKVDQEMTDRYINGYKQRFGNVITSYSIHYTKLYEEICITCCIFNL